MTPVPRFSIAFSPNIIFVPVWCPPPVRGEEGVQGSLPWLGVRGRTFGASAWGTVSDKYSRVKAPGDVASALRVGVGSPSDGATAVYRLGAAWGTAARCAASADPVLYPWGPGAAPVPPLPAPTGVRPDAVGTFAPAAVVAMQRGKETERDVAQLLGQYLDQLGCVPWVLPGEVFTGGHVHPPWPDTDTGTPRGVPAWVRISADGASPAPRGRVLFELKSRMAPWLPEDPPGVVPEYVLQVLTQLEATGATHGLLATGFVWRGEADAAAHPRWPAMAAAAGLPSLNCLRVDTITAGPASSAFLAKWLRIIGEAAAGVAGLPYRHDAPEGTPPLVMPEFGPGPAPSVTYEALFLHLHRARVEHGFWEDVAALCATCVSPGLSPEVAAALAPQAGLLPVVCLPRHV